MLGYVRTFFLLLVFTALFIAIGYLAALYLGAPPRPTMAVFLVIALIFNLVMFLFSHKIVLRMYRARVVTAQEAPRLHRIVDSIVLESGMPKPTVAIIPTRAPNAFATGRSPRKAVVACTAGILDLLDDRELRGVLAHEFSHVRNRDMLITTIAAVFASAISYMAYIFLFARSRDANPLIGLLVFITAPIAAMLVQAAISRTREFHADESGAKMVRDPQALASALEKLEHGVQAMPLRDTNPATSSLFIVNPFRSGGLTGLFRTHPPTAERVRRLRQMRAF